MTDKLPGETNFEMCDRIAREIPPEQLLWEIFTNLSNSRKGIDSELSSLLHYGKGVRYAIGRLYLRPLSLADAQKRGVK